MVTEDVEIPTPEQCLASDSSSPALPKRYSPWMTRTVSRILTSLFAAASEMTDNGGFVSLSGIAGIADLRVLQPEIGDLGSEIMRMRAEVADKPDLFDSALNIAESQSKLIVSFYASEADPLRSILLQYPARLKSIIETLGGMQRRQPAVPIAESITPDYLVCLEDGRQMKLLKRYLKQKFNMTPEQYRARWGLPDNYPMVAENYSKVRSKLAYENGLGHKSDGEQPLIPGESPLG